MKKKEENVRQLITELTYRGKSEWAKRLIIEPRLVTDCAACGHPGYMHEHAEEQFLEGDYGTWVYEAGDIACEGPDCDWNPDFSVYCGWYEGDN